MSISNFKIRGAATRLAEKVAYEGYYVTKHYGMMHFVVATFNLKKGSDKAYAIANRVWDSIHARFPDFGQMNDQNFKAYAAAVEAARPKGMLQRFLASQDEMYRQAPD